MLKYGKAPIEETATQPSDVPSSGADDNRIIKPDVTLAEALGIDPEESLDIDRDGNPIKKINESKVIDGDDPNFKLNAKEGEVVKFSMKEMATPPKKGEMFRVGPMVGLCIKIEGGCAFMEVGPHLPRGRNRAYDRISESMEVAKVIKVGDHVSNKSLSIPNDDFSKDSPFIKEYIGDAYYVVEKVEGNYVYCRIDAKWSKDKGLKKIHKSQISYVVRNGKIIAADHPTFKSAAPSPIPDTARGRYSGTTMVRRTAEDVLKAHGKNNGAGQYDEFVNKMWRTYKATLLDPDKLRNVIEREYKKMYGSVSESKAPDDIVAKFKGETRLDLYYDVAKDEYYVTSGQPLKVVRAKVKRFNSAHNVLVLCSYNYDKALVSLQFYSKPKN